MEFYVHVDALTYPQIAGIIPDERLVIETESVDSIFQMEIAIAKAIRKIRPALYHKLTGQLPFLPMRCPTVWGIADLGYRHLPMKPIQRLYKWLSYSISASRAAHIITISDSVRLETINALSVPSDKVTTIHLGTSQFMTKAEPVEGCPPAFLMTFGHQQHKNVETCIAVVKDLKSVGISIPLMVVGRVKPEWGLSKHAASLGVRDDIHFCGRLTDGQLRYLYERAVCLLFLSRHEGFGLPVLEAMGTGCPVIASNVFSLPEVVGDAAPKFCCDDAAGVAKDVALLIRHPDVRKARIKAGHDNACRFTWEKAAEETFEVYRTVLMQS